MITSVSQQAIILTDLTNSSYSEQHLNMGKPSCVYVTVNLYNQVTCIYFSFNLVDHTADTIKKMFFDSTIAAGFNFLHD